MSRANKLKVQSCDSSRKGQRGHMPRYLQENLPSEGSSCSITPSPSPQPSHGSVFTFDSFPRVNRRLASSSENGSPDSPSGLSNADVAAGSFYDPEHVYVNISYNPRSRSPAANETTPSRIGVDAADYANISLNYAELDHTPSTNAPPPRPQQPVKKPITDTVEYASIDMVATKAAYLAGKDHAQQREQHGQRMTNGGRSPSVSHAGSSPSSTIRKGRKGVGRSHSSVSRSYTSHEDKI